MGGGKSTAEKRPLDDDDEGRKKRTQSSLYVSHHTHTQIKHIIIMASKPTEMCVVEKSGAREYKVLLLLLFSFSSPSFPCERFVLPSSHCVCCDYSFFSLSLSAVTRSGGSPSPPLVVDVWRWKGGGRTSRAVLFSRPVEFRRRLFLSSQKLGAKRRAPLLETIGLMREKASSTPHSPSKIARNPIAPLETRANALEPSPRDFRVGNGFVRANRPRLSRCAVVDGSLTTKRRRSVTTKVVGPFFFPFFYLS